MIDFLFIFLFLPKVTFSPGVKEKNIKLIETSFFVVVILCF